MRQALVEGNQLKTTRLREGRQVASFQTFGEKVCLSVKRRQCPSRFVGSTA